MVLRKAARALGSLRRAGSRGGGDVRRGGRCGHAAAQDSTGTAASKSDVSAEFTSDDSKRGAIGGRTGNDCLLDGGCGGGGPPETTTAASSGEASLHGQLKGLVGQQERLLGGQAALVKCHAAMVKCVGEQGKEIVRVGDEIERMGEKIKVVVGEISSREASGGSVVEGRAGESGDEVSEGVAGDAAGATNNTEAEENWGGGKGGGVKEEGAGFDRPSDVVSSPGESAKVVEHLDSDEGGRGKDGGGGFVEPAAVVPSPLGRGGGSLTDRNRAYRANKRKRYRRNRRKRRGSVAPTRNGQGGTVDGGRVAQDGAGGGGGAKISRVVRFVSGIVGLCVMLSGLPARGGGGIMTLGHMLGEDPPALLDQESRPADLSSGPGKSVDPAAQAADAHAGERPPVDDGAGAAFWEAFSKTEEQANLPPPTADKSKKMLGSISKILDERAPPRRASNAENRILNGGGNLPSPGGDKNMRIFAGRVQPQRASRSKEGKDGPGPHILEETGLPVLYHFDYDVGCSSDPLGRHDPGVELYESVEECCKAVHPQGLARSICIALSPSPPEPAGSTFETALPMTLSPPTAPALPTASNGPTTVSEGSYAPPEFATASPSPSASMVPDGPHAIDEGSNIPTYPPTSVPTMLGPLQNINFYCVPDLATCGCPDLRGSDYRGSINTTKSGHSCLRWHSFKESIVEEYPDADTTGLDENRCRNPNYDPNGPWCFIEEDGSEIDYCNITSCVTHVCDADPTTCGCPHLSQRDYRGSISTTDSGHSCIRWNETSYTSEGVNLHGLEENYCRNPDHDEDGPSCCVSENCFLEFEEWEHCNVPACGTSPYICDAAPDACGCLDLRGSDYRGSTNITISGLPCLRWDMVYDADELERYSSCGLQGNFCRNPNNTAGGPWCFTSEEKDFEYCDVPACSARATSSKTSLGPTSSPGPTVPPSTSSSPFQTCQPADKTTCGCDVVYQTDYRGNISTTMVGLECMKWDSEQFKISVGWDALDHYPASDLEGNFCRSTRTDSYPMCYTAVTYYKNGTSNSNRDCNIPVCPACSCQPPCDKPNEAACGCPSVLQAENCCEDGDDQCKCSYLKAACGKGVEDNSKEFCDIAEEECCKGRNDPKCKCRMYEQICTEFPNQTTCQLAAKTCCGVDDNYYGDNIDEDDYDYDYGFDEDYSYGWGEEHKEPAICSCDFYNHIWQAKSLEIENLADSCWHKEYWTKRFTGESQERKVLKVLYDSTGGDSWRNNAGWLQEGTPHCKWFGIRCNEQDQVTEINLKRNNLTALPDTGVPFGVLAQLSELTSLDLSENKLSGKIHTDYLFFQSLRQVDLSGNYFSGHIDMALFPTASYVSLSQNKLTSVSFTPLDFKFNVAPYESLRVIDLSHNLIKQPSSEFLINIPLKLESLTLSYNAISGPLPNPLPPLERLEILLLDNNNLNGTLPDLHRSTPSLRWLDLSNQANGGLAGSIPATLSKLDDISVLNLAGNNFSGAIPDTFGSFERTKTLNLSSNALDQSIPPTLERLAGIIKDLDLSSNHLNGSIPFQLGKLGDTSIYLSGNPDLSNPAPLSLCFSPGLEFDLKNDPEKCPPERNALKDFYDSSKGQEWTKANLWGSEYDNHCSWYGVTCDPTNTRTIALELQSNGLSGTLSNSIGRLSSLEVLDVSDNDINGPIPKGIGRLSKLTKLMLKYNAFSDNVPDELGSLTHLESIQLQSNELIGEVPHVAVVDANTASSFIADCGYPSDFETALVCSNCTMCCNNEGGCTPTAKNPVQKAGFQNYMIFAVSFLGIIIAACAVLSLVVLAFDRHRMDQAFASSTDRNISRRSFILQQSSRRKEKDKEHAKNIMGDDSVYCFFLGTSLLGWVIAVATVAVQMWLLFVFVGHAEIDWTKEAVDFIYQVKCPKDLENCKSTSDLSPQGWVLFWILMAAHLLKDGIGGVKLLVLSGQERHEKQASVRYFFGGMLLITVTSFTLFVSAIYNSAIATSDTDIIMNSVVILFFTEIDELILGILVVISKGWVKHMSSGLVVISKGWVEHMPSGRGDGVEQQEPVAETCSHGREDEEGSEFVSHQLDQQVGSKSLADEVQTLKKMLEALNGEVKELQKENFKVKSIYGAP